MIVAFPCRFDALHPRAEIVYQETMERLLQEGGMELVSIFHCVGLLNWIRMHADPTEALIEFRKLVETAQGSSPRSYKRTVTCCWFVGEPSRGFRFCDAVSDPGTPYCSNHAAVVACVA